MEASRDKADRKGANITPTGLRPKYPTGYDCSPLTSLYASWIDVDGSHRNEIHSGVDGGRLDEPILAPGPGIVRAAWEANWGWGREGALLILHAREELGLREGPPYYYSEFDHLNAKEVRNFSVGQQITRGERLGHVFRPGGKKKYLEEVHWEVWEVLEDVRLQWHQNRYGARFWTNKSARLIDPLYMLSRNTPPHRSGEVAIAPYIGGQDYTAFKGFTYILPCLKSG